MKLIDSHAHLDFEQFHGDFNQVLERSAAANVEYIINIGADLKRSEASVAIADAHKNIFATVGVHPDEAAEVNFETIHDELIGLAKSSNKVVGVGECGVDYYQIDPSDNILVNKQKELFRIHIEVAKHLGLPLVVHIRNGQDDQAATDAYEILKESGYNRGVIHCFTLNSDWALKFVELGFKVGFTGIVTYKNTDEIRGAVKIVDIKDILIETDCPFLAPQNYRGQRNEPSYVSEVLVKISEIKESPIEKAAEIIYETTIDLFKLNEVV